VTVLESGRTPLSIPAFRRAWAGFTVSAAGDSASWIALVALCLGPADASLPILAAVYTAPVAIGGLAAGWLLDRFDRRLLIIVDSLVRSAVFASIPIAMAFGPPAALHLYAVAAVYGLLKMVSLAGFPALIPSLVPGGKLEQANALEGMSFGLASLSGAALAGVAVATVGAAPVVAVDAASYLALAIALLSIRGHGRPAQAIHRPGAERRRRGGFGSIMRLAVTHPVLRTTTIMFALFNIGEGCLLVFLPHRAVDLGLGSGGYGYLVAAMTGGQLLAGVVLARRNWPWPLRISIVIAQLAAATTVTVLIAPSTVSTLVVLALLGLLTAPMTAWAQTLRMRVVPPDGHGRLFALLRTAMQATPPLGAGLGALLLPHGPAVTVLTVAAVMGLPALLLGPSLVGRAASGSHDADQSTPATDRKEMVP
jgi:predicted MFS family arabinose efflux permease